MVRLTMIVREFHLLARSNTLPTLICGISSSIPIRKIFVAKKSGKRRIKNLIKHKSLSLVSTYYFFWGHFWVECPQVRTFCFYEFLRGLWYKIAGLIHFLGTNQLARSVRHSLWQGAPYSLVSPHRDTPSMWILGRYLTPCRAGGAIFNNCEKRVVSCI